MKIKKFFKRLIFYPIFVITMVVFTISALAAISLPEDVADELKFLANFAADKCDQLESWIKAKRER